MKLLYSTRGVLTYGVIHRIGVFFNQKRTIINNRGWRKMSVKSPQFAGALIIRVLAERKRCVADTRNAVAGIPMKKGKVWKA